MYSIVLFLSALFYLVLCYWCSHVSTSDRISIFQYWIIFHCVYTPGFLIYSVVDRLLAYLHYYELWCNEHMNVDIPEIYCCHFLWIPTHKWVDGSYGRSVFNYLKNLHTISIVTIPIYFPTRQCTCSLFSTSTSAPIYFFL